MAVNKVDYYGENLIDLSTDTVTPETLAEGETAHGADGEPIVGLLYVTEVDSELSNSSTNPVQNKVVTAALNGKSIIKTLTTEDLNTIFTPGFYNSPGGNSVVNKPANAAHFGMQVIHTAGGSYYVQILYPDNEVPYVRRCSNNVWSDWVRNDKPSVELTQAEYDTLPDTKNSDNVTYYITDG